MFYHILLIFNMFRSPLRTSSGYFDRSHTVVLYNMVKQFI